MCWGGEGVVRTGDISLGLSALVEICVESICPCSCTSSGPG